MTPTPRARSLVSAALLTSFAASIATVGSVAASNPDDLDVSGTSTSTITLSLDDVTAAFGTTLTPTGAASGGEGVLVETVAAGSCYDWAGTVSVSSNVDYEVSVDPLAANDNLDFMTSNPADHAACTGGTAITTASFVPFDGQLVTAGRDHDYWLGLDVAWADGPSGTLGVASLTFEAVANI